MWLEYPPIEILFKNVKLGISINVHSKVDSISTLLKDSYCLCGLLTERLIFNSNGNFYTSYPRQGGRTTPDR